MPALVSTDNSNAGALRVPAYTSNAPRFPGSPLLLTHLRQWRQDPVRLITDAAQLGRVVRLDLPGRTYLVTHPADVKHVLQDNHKNYCKGWVFDRIKPYWGDSLLTADGDTWRRQRHRVQPSFKREHTAGFAPIVTRRTQEMLARWKRPDESRPGHDLSAIAGSATAEVPRLGELRMYDEMTQLALVIIGDVLFGLDMWSDVPEMTRAAQAALAVLKRRVAALAPPPLWLPTPDNSRFNGAMRVLNGYIEDILRRTREAGSSSTSDNAPSFLKMLMDARDSETGSPMTDRQLHEEILGMLQQGHDTVGEALAWVWYLLSLHPEAERRLYREVCDVLGDRAPDVGDLPRLPYAHKVLQEAMRLYPPVWVIPRDAMADDEIAGVRIPAKSTILLSPYVTHRHPDFWDNPEAFDPDRFDAAVAKERPRHAYFPFGGGPRLCMGADMATMEMMLILTTVVQRYRLPLASCHREEVECILDMLPRHGVRVTPRLQQPIAAPRTIPTPLAARCPFGHDAA
jgi:cytochrome P450